MSSQPIVIKKTEEGDHGGHHGGGWKVAYADFMTAMMAFFLLLWILAASDEEKLRGLADYFTPSLSEAGGRGQGMLAGQVLAEDGMFSGTDGPQSEVQLPSFGQENPLAVFDSRLREDQRYAAAPSEAQEGDGDNEARGAVAQKGNPESDSTEAGDAADPQVEVTRSEAREGTEGALAELVKQEEQRTSELEALENEIKEDVAADPMLAGMQQHLRFDVTSQGLEIQIVDAEGRSMFEVGSSKLEGRPRRLVEVMAQTLAKSDRPLTIAGHTDSLQFAEGANYGNWELSADRANATRRLLLENSVAEARVMRISGLADTEPLIADRPDAAENRRISVLLEYKSQTDFSQFVDSGQN